MRDLVVAGVDVEAVEDEVRVGTRAVEQSDRDLAVGLGE